MKTCPYCAEEIKDAAIRCRWCQTWLVDEIPAGAEGPPPKLGERRSGLREVLKPVPPTTVQPVGTEARPAQPAASEAKPAQPTPAGQPATQAPGPQPTVVPTPAVQPTGVSASPTPSSQSQPAAGQGPPAAQSASSTQAGAAGQAAQPMADIKIEFTHTGSRYLLGYGADYFGIWDRNAPQQPVERFSRNDQGWATAWQRYVSIENNWMDLRSGQKSS